LGNEASSQPSTTQDLPVIVEDLEHIAFGNILEVELQHAANNNTFTTVTRSSQNVRGPDSTQTNGGILHQSPPRAPLPIQVIQENAELEQLQVEDWEDDIIEDKAVEEAELAKVQQEIERLRQEQEAITRRQAIAQRVETGRQYINRERATLEELQYAIDILCQ
jgi:hypothetical protein